jgi:hypothetical protein
MEICEWRFGIRNWGSGLRLAIGIGIRDQELSLGFGIGMRD